MPAAAGASAAGAAGTASPAKAPTAGESWSVLGRFVVFAQVAGSLCLLLGSWLLVVLGVLKAFLVFGRLVVLLCCCSSANQFGLAAAKAAASDFGSDLRGKGFDRRPVFPPPPPGSCRFCFVLSLFSGGGPVSFGGEGGWGVGALRWPLGAGMGQALS